MPATIHAAAAELRQGRTSAVQLLDQCLAQIDRYEPGVRAWVLVDRERARQDATRLDDELRRGQDRGPLHGIPIGVKDIFDVFDWPTAAGSKRWAQSYARRDGTVVERLRRAGTVFIGKTVTTAYASFDPPPTRNPWNHDRTPGGSSSGSAAGLACGMMLGALGSQTGGSIIRPASFCGVCGIKPTYGRVSLDGIVPLSPSLDHPGPMAGCVRDLALMLQVMAGPDPRDPFCVDRPVPDFLAHAPRPPRLGRVSGLFHEQAEPPMRELMDRVSEQFRARGATVTAVGQPAGFADVIPRHRTIMAVEAAAYHHERLARYPDDYPPKVAGLIRDGQACPAPEYARCREHQRQLQRDVLQCFGEADILLTPPTLGPAPDTSTTGGLAFQAPWSYTGLPTLSLPAGWTSDGLPLCIQLTARPWAEAELIAAGLWCEEALAFEKRQPAIR
jgi:aspartyl-tRNA(Asn)/glutamyl-tRNA(Gln) amidotransferase subunit A